MAWEDDAADWEKYANSDVEESSDDDAEAIKKLKAEAEAEKNKPKKLSLAERKAQEEADRKAEQENIDAAVRTFPAGAARVVVVEMARTRAPHCTTRPAEGESAFLNGWSFLNGWFNGCAIGSTCWCLSRARVFFVRSE